MATSSQKSKIMNGMSHRTARKRLKEIFAEKEPGVNFEEKYPGVFVWMEIWYGLRQHSKSFDIVAQAFAEKVSRLHGEKRALETTVHNQREELKKMLADIERERRFRARFSEKMMALGLVRCCENGNFSQEHECAKEKRRVAGEKG